MDLSQLSYNEFYFHLQNLISDEEKLTYLYKMKIELRKMINSFEESFQLPLRMFLDEYFFSNEEYKLVHLFLKKVVENQRLNLKDKRYFGDDYLRQLLNKELTELNKLESLVDSEIEFLKSNSKDFNLFKN